MSANRNPKHTELPTPQCPFCGSDEFEWGVANGRAEFVYRSEKESSSGLSVSSGRQLKARRCLGCGNVQLFTHKR